MPHVKCPGCSLVFESRSEQLPAGTVIGCFGKHLKDMYIPCFDCSCNFGKASCKIEHGEFVLSK